MNDLFWGVVVVVAILLALVLIVRAVSGRRKRTAFEIRGLPASYRGPYEARMVELRAMFVSNPREAVAGAKQLVDDMTMRMGYPTRLTDRERMADMAVIDRRHADRYRAGLELKPDSTTEEMRRVLQAYLDLGRELIDSKPPEQVAEAETRSEIAG